MERVSRMLDVLESTEDLKQNIELNQSEMDFADDVIEKDEVTEITEIPIVYKDVEALELPEIRDEYGRLSDAIEALERATGLSVIPLRMANIAPEVVSLKRHTIYTFDGERFAMSQRIRSTVVNTEKERIVQSLLSGLPFKANLVTKVNYNGTEYRTLSLSQEEWDYILSTFRRYKQSLYIQNGNQLVLEIFAERV